MIETAAGIDHLEEIIATEDLTAVYVGPSDLSLALGLDPGSIDAPEFVSALEQIRVACLAHGVVAGIHCYDGAIARHTVEQGFGMVTVAVDLRLLRSALTAELDFARDGTRPAEPFGRRSAQAGRSDTGVPKATTVSTRPPDAEAT